MGFSARSSGIDRDRGGRGYIRPGGQNQGLGIGFIPFQIPGSAELMVANVEALRRQRIVIWAKHGLMARSDTTIKHAADLIDYAETAAKYEYFNLSIGEIGEGLRPDELRSICAAFKVKQNIF